MRALSRHLDWVDWLAVLGGALCIATAVAGWQTHSHQLRRLQQEDAELMAVKAGMRVSIIGAGDQSVNGWYSSGPFDPNSPHSLGLKMRPENWEKPGSYLLKVGEENSYFPHRLAWWPASIGVPAGWYVDQGIRGMYFHPGGSDGVIPLGQWAIYVGPRSDPGMAPAPLVTMFGHMHGAKHNSTLWLTLLMSLCVGGCMVNQFRKGLRRRNIVSLPDDGLDSGEGSQLTSELTDAERSELAQLRAGREFSSLSASSPPAWRLKTELDGVRPRLEAEE